MMHHHIPDPSRLSAAERAELREKHVNGYRFDPDAGWRPSMPGVMQAHMADAAPDRRLSREPGVLWHNVVIAFVAVAAITLWALW